MKTVVIVLLCSLLAGCATQTATPTSATKPYTADFSYTPPASTAAPAGMTFTVRNVTFNTANHVMWFLSPSFAGLPKALVRDLTAILKSKGFDVRGPFASKDLIPYPDKKVIDLALVPDLTLTLTCKDQKQDLENMWAYKPPMVQTGTAEVAGSLKLEMREIATDELMWVKIIPLQGMTFPYRAKVPWGQPSKPDQPYSLGPIYEGMARGLAEQYAQVMSTVDSLISPEEITALKAQCHDLKTKKGY